MDAVRIRYIKDKLAQLPMGNITYKTINNKKYPYYQWTENGKQRGRRVKDDELELLTEQIAERKELQQLLREVQGTVEAAVLHDEYFFSVLKRGQELESFVAPVVGLKKRECFNELHNYVYGNSTDRVMILYGLRRTGKTTLIRQLIAAMNADMRSKTVYIQINSSIDLAKINLDLKQLAKQGYKYIFIDEVTLMEDFIEGAALFSDIYASSGMKIVLSGTDSLGFIFSEDRELYDRCFMIHTTFVPYREFANVLGLNGIDEYIRYGGTMSLGGIDYNHTGMTFATTASTNEYVDSAIARNIQHSLKNYQQGDHFRHLEELYEANELTSAINRIVEDINHRFTIEVLTKDFKSNDLALSAKNLLRDRQAPNDVLYRVDKQAINEKLRQLLEIKNKPEQRVPINDAHKREIKEYLDFLDLTVDVDIVYLPDFEHSTKHTVITQPGMRYAQAEALVKTLMQDRVFFMLSLVERNAVTKRIMSDIQGRMLEDIVLLETKLAYPHCDVFKLVFATGEFDMVIADPEAACCQIFEIKHSAEIAPSQYRHLLDADKCQATEFRFGAITGKYVLYRGPACAIEGVHYLNVEEYLLNLSNKES